MYVVVDNKTINKTDNIKLAYFASFLFVLYLNKEVIIMIIDFHTHTFPDKIAAAAIDKLQHASHSKAFTSGTVSGLQASMQRAGIDRRSEEHTSELQSR